MKRPQSPLLLPGILLLAGLAAFGFWLSLGPGTPIELRVPGRDHAPDSASATGANPALSGKVTRGQGEPAGLPGAWPQFRGALLDNTSHEPSPLLRSWPAGGPRELWAVDLGEGYAGPAVLNGRVFLMDYDQEKRQDALRCFSFSDGRELWRFTYPVAVKRNHGMSRTTPAVTDKIVIAMGPKCHVVALDPVSGELRWTIDLVREYGTAVPQWYAGQCPFIENGITVLAPAGRDTLLFAAEAETGKVLWRSPNPRDWKMTHSSVTPMQFAGDEMYIYCADKGVAGISARDGRILWETTDWKISIATVPSPIALPDGRIFFSGGYNAGSLMMQLRKEGDSYKVDPLFRLPAKVFGATQQTPVLFGNHIYGVRPDGRFACLTLSGEAVWSSEPAVQFGLGAYVAAEQGLIYAVNDTGLLRMLALSPERCQVLGEARVLQGHDAWGPLALTGGRLLVRDLTRMVCLEVGAPVPGPTASN